MNKPVKITVSDPDTKEILGESVIENDYTVVCAGNRYIDSIQTHANGTHVLTIKRDKVTLEEDE